MNNIKSRYHAGMFIVGSTQLEVGTDHPEVLAAIEEEANHARIAEFPITVDMYMTALQEGIKTARERTREINPGEIRFKMLIEYS